MAAFLKICYEVCQTSTVQDFVHCRSSVTQASQVSRLKPTGLLCVGMDERTGLQCEGGNARCIAWSHFERRIAHQNESAEVAKSAVHNRATACVTGGGGIFKTTFKHRSVQIKGNFTKLTLHLYFKCIMYYAGLIITRQILKFVCLLLAYCLSVLNMDSKHDSRIEIK